MDYVIKLQSNKSIIQSDSTAPKILKITTNPNLPKILRTNKALIVDNPELLDVSDYGMVFSTHMSENTEVEFLDTQLSYLEDGDVIRVVPNSNSVRAIYRINASANFLFRHFNLYSLNAGLKVL